MNSANNVCILDLRWVVFAPPEYFARYENGVLQQWWPHVR